MVGWLPAVPFALVALLAPPAHAGTVDAVSPDPPVPGSVSTLDYRAAPGELNDLSVVYSERAVRLHDAGAPIQPGANCAAQGADVVCRLNPEFTSSFDLGDGDDRGAGLSGSVTGGPGDDSVSGLYVAFDGGPGADTLSCTATGVRSGQGYIPFATVTYASRLAAVRVTPNGVADDGETGEGDNVPTCADLVVGGAGDDTLMADHGGSRSPPAPTGPGGVGLDGGAGNDLLVGGPNLDNVDGGPGDDLLTGGDGYDFLAGGDGNDTLEGDAGGDTLTGDDGNDRLSGAGGRNSLAGGNGDDTIDGGADVDRIDDGAGDDTVDGGSGDDILDVGSGHDTIRGGDGIDMATYQHHEGSLVLTLDGQRNDGQSGENDLLAADVEGVGGGPGDDIVIGDEADNRLDGGPGGVNTVDGRGGQDTLRGRFEEGRPETGRSTLIGGGGRDRFEGVGPKETVRARDGEVDELDCSPQQPPFPDVEIDLFDFAVGCLPYPSVVVPATGRRLRLTRSGALIVYARCVPGSQFACAGLLRLTAGGRPIAVTDFKAAPGHRRRLAIRLGKTARRAVRRRGGLKVKAFAVLSPNGEFGGSTTTARWTLLSPRRR